MTTKTYAIQFILLATALLLPSCSYQYDMVTFNAVGLMPDAKKSIPDIAIDTNLDIGLLGGEVKSKKPYNVLALYVDYTFAIATAEFTKVTVTYADGTVDSGIAALKLPMCVPLSVYEVRNKNSGGSGGIADSRRLEAKFPGIINRDQPFTLLIDGKFTKDNGTIIPFKIKERYNMSRDKRNETMVDYINNC